jgi:transposase-like protein
MIVQSACDARPAPLLAPKRLVQPESFGRPKCPRCGSVLLVAEQSGFNMRGRIDHSWSCDDCGNEFVTSIRL